MGYYTDTIFIVRQLQNKSTSQTLKRKSKLLQLSFWGPVIGLIGGLIGIAGGGIALIDRFFPPSIEVIGILPVFIYGEDVRTIGEEKSIPKLRGVAVITRIKSGGRPISITAMEVSGKRYLAFDEWMGYFSYDGAKWDDLSRKYETSKTYYQVAFSGWLTDTKASIRLDPYEESLIRFSLVDPTEVYRPILVDLNYVGSEKESKKPTIRRVHPEWRDFFILRSNGTAEAIRNEFQKGLLTFSIVAGSIKVVVPPSKILSPRNIGMSDWQEKPIQYLYSDRFN